MIIYTDGRPTKVAYLVEVAGKVFACETVEIPFSTNFEAEYRSVIEALKYLASHKQYGGPVVIFNDNATVISQIVGKARVFEPRLKVLRDEVVGRAANFTYTIKFLWIEKKRNKAHDLF